MLLEGECEELVERAKMCGIHVSEAKNMKSKGKQGPCTSITKGEGQKKAPKTDDAGREAHLKNAYF